MRYAFVAAVGLLLIAEAAVADQQEIAPGTGLQNSTVISTGADGLCSTATATGDIQAAPVGGAQPNLTEVRCGGNKVADSAAAGDDVQLVAVGGACKNANTAIIDTGPDGIPNSSLTSDDTYASGIALGVPPANKKCVIAGADGVAQTTTPAGDDVLVLTTGTAEANTEVLLCGPNGIADSPANNVAAGDDVQVVLVGNACSAGDVVVDAGPDGIATTRAEGPDLQIKAVNRVKVTIGPGKPSASKTIKLKVSNVEFGSGAPATRSFEITTSSSTCPNGLVTQIDADVVMPGLQVTGAVPLGASVQATLVATVKLQDITTTNAKAPFRCSFEVNAVALDTAPDVDDGANPEGNTTIIEVESVDKNDL